MLIIDLLSTDNYVSFNISLAHLLGLEQSIYISELLRINSKAIKKDKLDNDYMIIDRSYIESRTTFDEAKQNDLDNDLIKLGILTKNDDNSCMLSLHIDVITTLLMGDSEALKTDIAKIVKNKAKKKTKQEVIIEQLKTNIVTSNVELRQAYFDWIDSVYAKPGGFLSKKAVIAAQNTIDSFTNRNLDLALKIIEIASIGGYRDMNWAINSYNQNYKVNYKVANQPAYRPVQSEINKEVVF